MICRLIPIYSILPVVDHVGVTIKDGGYPSGAMQRNDGNDHRDL